DNESVPTLKRLDAGKVAPLSEDATFVHTAEREGMLITDNSVMLYELNHQGDWVPKTRINMDGDKEPAIDRVVDSDGQDIPTILERIRNGDDDTSWGMSDLAVAVPQQRAINQRVIDIHQVSGTAAW